MFSHEKKSNNTGFAWFCMVLAVYPAMFPETQMSMHFQSKRHQVGINMIHRSPAVHLRWPNKGLAFEGWLVVSTHPKNVGRFGIMIPGHVSNMFNAPTRRVQDGLRQISSTSPNLYLSSQTWVFANPTMFHRNLNFTGLQSSNNDNQNITKLFRQGVQTLPSVAY